MTLGLYLSPPSPLTGRMEIQFNGPFQGKNQPCQLPLSRGQAAVFKTYFHSAGPAESWVNSEPESVQWVTVGQPGVWLCQTSPWSCPSFFLQQHSMCFQGGPSVVGRGTQWRGWKTKPTSDGRLVRSSGWDGLSSPDAPQTTGSLILSWDILNHHHNVGTSWGIYLFSSHSLFLLVSSQFHQAPFPQVPRELSEPMHFQCHCFSFAITDEYLWLFNIIGISSAISPTFFFEARKRLLRRNYVTLETTASIGDILWQWKVKFQMLGFHSPKQWEQGRERWEPGQELIRDLLISLPAQLGVQGGQLGKALGDRSRRAAPLAPAAGWGTVLLF